MDNKDTLKMEFHQNSMAFEEDLKAMLPYFTVKTIESPVKDDGTGYAKYLCAASVLFKGRFIGTINCFITRDMKEMKYTRVYHSTRMNKDTTFSTEPAAVHTLREAVDFIMKDE